MEKRIIFLDIDGVLRSFQAYTDRANYDPALGTTLANIYHNDGYRHLERTLLECVYYDWNKEACYCLRSLVKQSGARIVLSSSWRLYNDLAELRLLFALFDMGEYLIDKTKDHNFQRAQEIQEYLDQHKDITSFLILDDIDLRQDFPNRCIVTQKYLRLSEFQDGLDILLRPMDVSPFKRALTKNHDKK